MTSDVDIATRSDPSTPARPASATPDRSPRTVLLVLIGVAALVSMVSSLGAPLIPAIASDNHVSLSTAQWLLTAALLTGALVTPVMGRLADGPSKRTVIMLSLGTVMAGCVLSALSTSFGVMVLGRALQGVGLGLLPVVMAIARNLFTPERATRAIATLSVTAAVGAGLGYPLTGLIADLFSFRAAFWFGAIVVGAVLAAAVLVLPVEFKAPSRRFDLWGAVTLGLAVIGVTVVLSEGEVWGYASSRTLAVLVAALAMGALFAGYELRRTDPLIDVRQVRNKMVLTADVAGFLMAVAMYLFLPIIVEFVQVPASEGYGFGVSIVVSGLVFVPLSITSFLSSRFLPFSERTLGVRAMIPIGCLIFASATTLFALFHTQLWEAFFVSGLTGIGIGLTFAAMPGFIVRSVPRGETGSAMGFYQVLRSVGLSVGSALAAAVLAGFTHGGATFPSVRGFTATLLLASGISVLTAVVTFFLPGRARAGKPLDAELSSFTEEEGELAATALMTGDADTPRPSTSSAVG